MHATRYGTRPHPAIEARKRKIAEQNKAQKREHIKNNLMLVVFFLCVFASGFCN